MPGFVTVVLEIVMSGFVTAVLDIVHCHVRFCDSRAWLGLFVDLLSDWLTGFILVDRI